MSRLRLRHRRGATSLRPGLLFVGRDPVCGCALAGRGLAPLHAVVVVQPECVLLYDLGTEHGTKHNGERLEGHAVLRHGDQVELGDETLFVEALFAEEG